MRPTVDSVHVVANYNQDAHVAVLCAVDSGEYELLFEPIVAWEVIVSAEMLSEGSSQISKTFTQAIPIVASGVIDDNHAVYYISTGAWYIAELSEGHGAQGCLEALLSNR
ncbi:hypothetical protein [Endozoicomonas atrinae]|uniref:hypothetical protein n=1 Tax=Endozoicomonas atrinae TaxID=1333660 RepID=UPI000ADA2962|nr:hypothetical protein [Endozoicomonas atrinae]